MHPTRGRTGVSKLAISVALVAVLVVAGAYVFLTSSATSSRNTSSSSLPTAPVSNSVSQLIQDLNQRNVDGLITFYSPNAVDVWSGDLVGLQGKYTSAGNIRLLYATTIGKSTTVDANYSDYAEDTFSPTHINATFVVGMLANSTEAGIVTAKIDVTEEWNWGGGGWQISNENWVYKYYDSSFVDNNIPSSTTFPQWGYTLKGGNPNLVSEKSFEWHAGPYVAATVYAFLFGVVAVLALRFRSRGEEGARQDENRPSITRRESVPDDGKLMKGASKRQRT